MKSTTVDPLPTSGGLYADLFTLNLLGHRLTEGQAGQGISSQTSSRKNRRSSAQPPDGAEASSPMGTNATP
jgi:hypothetical protein